MTFPIILNFKMNKNLSEIWEYIDKLNNFNYKNNIELIISPPTIYLSEFFYKLKSDKIKLSSQNIHFKDYWAYTWETSVKMIKDFWCRYIILWHSERREIFWETNEIINKKIKSSVDNNIKPILCIWENINQKNNWETNKILKKQIEECIKSIDINKINIAYEPIWAIWTGNSASIEDIKKAHSFIRELIWRDKSTKLLYWWSVWVENSKEISNIKNVDWLLIWSAWLKIENVKKIINII